MLTELLTIPTYIIIFSSLQRNPILTRGHTSLSPHRLASTHITINLSIYSLILDRTHKWHHAKCKLVTDLLDLVWCFWASLFFPDVSVLLLLYVSNVLLCGHIFCLCLHQLVALRLPPLLAHYKWCFHEHSCVFVGKVFISVRHMLRSIVQSHGTSVFTIVRNCQTIFDSGYIICTPAMMYESSNDHILA